MALVIWFSVSRGLRNRTLYFAVGCVAAYIFIDVFSNRTPVQVIFDYAALNPWTGYYRTLIWQFGWADFLSSPIVGIGYNDWARPIWMSASVDTFWLILLLRYGLLAVAPLVLGIGMSLHQSLMRYFPKTEVELDLAYFWLASLISLLIAGFTVHFWEQSYVELFFLVGSWGAFVGVRQSGSHCKAPFAEPARLGRKFGAKGPMA